jgi:hypothetical protein
MATCEYIEYKAVCPCGQGSLKRVFASPDSAYARPWWSDISFDCADCRAQWSPSYSGKELFRIDPDAVIPRQRRWAEYRHSIKFPLVWRT